MLWPSGFCNVDSICSWSISLMNSFSPETHFWKYRQPQTIPSISSTTARGCSNLALWMNLLQSGLWATWGQQEVS